MLKFRLLKDHERVIINNVCLKRNVQTYSESLTCQHNQVAYFKQGNFTICCLKLLNIDTIPVTEKYIIGVSKRASSLDSEKRKLGDSLALVRTIDNFINSSRQV